MKTRTFKKEELLDLELPYSGVLEEKIIDTSRWHITTSIVFEYDGKFYQTTYSMGATESQDESPWEYDKEVKCVEVEKKLVTKEEWVPSE